MKKLISSALICILFLMQFTFISSASYSEEKIFSEQKDLSFSKTVYSNLSDRQIAKNKLEQLDIPESIVEKIPNEYFKAIAKSVRIISSISYYSEDKDSDKLIPISKSEYKKAVKWHHDNIELLKSQYNTHNSLSTTNNVIIHTSDGNSKNIDGGKLGLVILVLAQESGDFLTLGISQWEVLPLLRFTDAIGLSRGEGISVKEKSAKGVYSYSYVDSPYGGTATSHTVDEPIFFNDLEVSSNGYAYEFLLFFNVFENIEVNGTMTKHLLRLYTDATCFISYEGSINNDNIKSFNHWLTYAHKHLGFRVNGIDFSIPFNVGFSVNFGAIYTQMYEENLWYR